MNHGSILSIVVPWIMGPLWEFNHFSWIMSLLWAFFGPSVIFERLVAAESMLNFRNCWVNSITTSLLVISTGNSCLWIFLYDDALSGQSFLIRSLYQTHDGYLRNVRSRFRLLGLYFLGCPSDLIWSWLGYTCHVLTIEWTTY